MKRGFTLVELLVTVSIIGLLAVTASTSYQYVRARARDTRRVSDISAIHSAIELYFEQNSKYPDAPHAGLVLGADDAKMISDGGITRDGAQKGIVYMQNVPYNMLPHGVPYLYHAKHKDGSLCDHDCESYEVSFELETPTGELAAGPHLLTDTGILGSERGASGVSTFATLTQYLPTQEQIATAFGTAQETAALARQAAMRPDVQAANRMLIAPAAALGALASLIAAASGALPLGSAGQFAFVLFTQPFLLFAGRKNRQWGVVFRSDTRVPIDLATVRLIDTRTNRAAATKVTDKDGRFAFAPRMGDYRLEVVKPGFIFPSAALQGTAEVGLYTDLYHGTILHADGSGQALTVNVPLDPAQAPLTEARDLLTERNKKSLRKAFALVGPSLAALALAVTPSVPMLLLFLIQLFFYQLFKRFSEPPKPKSQGVVHDIDTRKPIAGAVVRVLSLPYHKVLETQLADAQGRYHFNVGAGVYYLTALKPGYEKTETDEIDFTKNDKPAWIAADLPMRRAVEKAG